MLQKGKEVGEFTKEVAGDVKDAVFSGSEAAERKRREEEERKRKGRGLFGLFGKKA